MDKVRVGLLGATGSIGRQTLDVIRSLTGYELSLVSACNNGESLSRIIEEFHPKTAVSNAKNVVSDGKCQIYSSTTALSDANLYEDCDVVLNGIGGMAGLKPTLAVLSSGARLATANKESIVSAGSLIKSEAKKHNKTLIPVDSEHSAVFQCLERGKAKKIILTASGGAFRDKSAEELKSVTASDALKHPTWVMGKKVTVDSATLFNKCLEVIEARNLFDICDIEVLIHRQSIVHSLVEFEDGFIKASLSATDMRMPIQYALTYPNRSEARFGSLDLAKIGCLSFEQPDYKRFPCLLLKDVIDCDGRGAVACAADEAAVELFMQNKLSFNGIYKLVSDALERFDVRKITTADEVCGIEREVREYTLKRHSENKELYI